MLRTTLRWLYGQSRPHEPRDFRRMSRFSSVVRGFLVFLVATAANADGVTQQNKDGDPDDPGLARYVSVSGNAAVMTGKHMKSADRCTEARYTSSHVGIRHTPLRTQQPRTLVCRALQRDQRRAIEPVICRPLHLRRRNRGPNLERRPGLQCKCRRFSNQQRQR